MGISQVRKLTLLRMMPLASLSSGMTAQMRGLNMATKNANDGLSMLAVVENATNDVTDMLQRVRELAVQAVNDTNSNPDRQNLQEEARALIAEIDRVASATQYNGTNILDGSFTDKKLQLGYNAGDTINHSIGALKAEQLGSEQTQNLGTTLQTLNRFQAITLTLFQCYCVQETTRSPLLTTVLEATLRLKQARWTISKVV